MQCGRVTGRVAGFGGASFGGQSQCEVRLEAGVFGGRTRRGQIFHGLGGRAGPVLSQALFEEGGPRARIGDREQFPAGHNFERHRRGPYGRRPSRGGRIAAGGSPRRGTPATPRRGKHRGGVHLRGASFGASNEPARSAPVPVILTDAAGNLVSSSDLTETFSLPAGVSLSASEIANDPSFPASIDIDAGVSAIVGGVFGGGAFLVVNFNTFIIASWSSMDSNPPARFGSY